MIHELKAPSSDTKQPERGHRHAARSAHRSHIQQYIVAPEFLSVVDANTGWHHKVAGFRILPDGRLWPERPEEGARSRGDCSTAFADGGCCAIETESGDDFVTPTLKDGAVVLAFDHDENASRCRCNEYEALSPTKYLIADEYIELHTLRPDGYIEVEFDYEADA